MDEACLQQAGVVGLSNFSALFSSLLQSNEGDAHSAQIAEVKKKLADSENRREQAAEMQLDAEGYLQAKKKEFDNANQQIAVIAASRSKLDAELAVKQLEVEKLKHMQAAAEQRLRKAVLVQASAQAQKDCADCTSKAAHEEQAFALSLVAQARESMLAAEDDLSESIQSVRHVLSLVDVRGCAVANSIVDAAPLGLHVTQRAFELVCNSIDVVNASQAELQLAWNQLCKADTSRADMDAAQATARSVNRESSALADCTQDRVNAEAAYESVQARVEQAQESSSQCAKALLVAGHAFVNSFRKAKAVTVTASRVSCAHGEALAAFDRLHSSWETTRRMQEGWLRANKPCREPLRKLVIVATVSTAALERFAEVENVTKEAAADEALCRAKRDVREAEVMAAQAARVEADVLDAEWKRRRDELRARLGAAHLESLKSRAAAREAAERRSALQAWSHERKTCIFKWRPARCLPCSRSRRRPTMQTKWRKHMK